jgi:hypothetical protein
MAEQYDVAAGRHLQVGRNLLQHKDFDNAGYHLGVSGECALKYGLLKAGTSIPRKHFRSLAGEAAKEVASRSAAFATGRISAPIVAIVSDPSFPQRFRGWSINIRYADTSCTPVTRADCDRWCKDASELVARLVIG